MVLGGNDIVMAGPTVTSGVTPRLTFVTRMTAPVRKSTVVRAAGDARVISVPCVSAEVHA